MDKISEKNEGDVPIAVLFDALIMTEHSFGYATVIRSYLDALEDFFQSGEGAEVVIYVVFQRRALLQLDPYSKLRRSPNFRFIMVPNIRHVIFRSLFEQIFINILALIKQCSIIHMPATLGLMFSVRPQILFFHASTTFKLDRRMHGRSLLSTWFQNIVIRRSAAAAALLAVTTKSTAEELFEYLGKSRPYHVLGDGVRALPEEAAQPKLEALLGGRRFALYVSSFYELKNQRLLISTFARSKNHDDMCLILVGGRAQRKYFETCVEASAGSTNILMPEEVDDQALAWLYRRCSIYINPSLFEGFSLTPLEALSFACPIILSDIPVHREVYGEGFQYFDPRSSESLDKALAFSASVTYDQKCRDAGASLLEKYTWKNFAIKNVELYRKAVALRLLSYKLDRK